MSAVEVIKLGCHRVRVVLRQPWPAIRRSVNLFLREILAIPGNKIRAIPNRAYLKALGVVSLPPASLRRRVSGETAEDLFLNKGRVCSRDILAALRRQGRELSSFQTVLDFGCGCGRTLLWWKLPPAVEFHGTDIDSEAIRWCETNYRRGQFSVNEPLPPLKYSDNKFDLIYGISILTHLNEEFQFRWLEELKRIAKPGGLVLLTLHGEFVWSRFSPKIVAQVKRQGILFIVDHYWKDAFPDWYQSAFHSKEYVMENFSKYFKIVDYIPRGLHGYQDIIILQKE